MPMKAGMGAEHTVGLLLLEQHFEEGDGGGRLEKEFVHPPGRAVHQEQFSLPHPHAAADGWSDA